MKIVAFNGSPRKGGNTEMLINEVFKPIQEAGIETELVQLERYEVAADTPKGSPE